MTPIASWLDDVEQDARRYSVVFVHLGRAFTPLRADLGSASVVGLRVSEYLDGLAVADGPVIVLTDVEECAGSRGQDLGTLRSRVIDDIDTRGRKFVLMSNIARSAFPDVVGSDLLADAKHVFVAPGPESSGQSGMDALVGWNVETDSLEDFLASCVSELSAESVINLGELLWDLGLSPNESLAALTPLDRESFRGAGLLRVEGEKLSWVAVHRWKDFRSAVAIASSQFMTAEDWLGRVFVDLWLIERQIRNALREALMSKHGKSWRNCCAAEALATDVVARARRDVHLRAENIKDLRDPLEWLTTGELLDLRQTGELGELGLESYMWTKLKSDLLPIRNRAAHMRVISERDALTVSTWRKLVMFKLCRS